ncbi:MAG: alpha/beta fold hydrolase [Leptospirales bacterium]
MKQSVQKTKFTARAADGCDLRIYGYVPAEPSGPSVLLFPAMGVPGRAYAKVCNALASRGFPVYVTDLRGTGESGPAPSRRVDFNYDTYLKSDWPAVIEAVRENARPKRLLLAGHSIGAQLNLIYLGLHPDSADGLVLFTPNTSYYKCFPGASALRFRVWFHLMPALVTLLGYFPGDRLGFGGKNAAGVIRDWAYTGRTGRFRGSDGTDLEPAFAKVRAPVAAISFGDDALAPRAAADHLLGRLDPEIVSRLDLEARSQKEMGHFGWMRDTSPYLEWLVDWLHKV